MMLGWALIQYGRLDTPPWSGCKTISNLMNPMSVVITSPGATKCGGCLDCCCCTLSIALYWLCDTDLIAASVNYSVVVTVIPTKYSIYRVWTVKLNYLEYGFFQVLWCRVWREGVGEWCSQSAQGHPDSCGCECRSISLPEIMTSSLASWLAQHGLR